MQQTFGDANNPTKGGAPKQQSRLTAEQYANEKDKLSQDLDNLQKDAQKASRDMTSAQPGTSARLREGVSFHSGNPFTAAHVTATKSVMGIPDEPFWAPDDLVNAYRTHVASRAADAKASWRSSVGDREKEVVDGQNEQLYDLAKDPGETKNLAGQNLDVVARLKAKLEASKAKGVALPLPL